jgi:hypothetical protein
MTIHTSIFTDGVLEASVQHGVARLTLGQHGGDGKPVAVGQLVLPLSQLPAFANSMLGLMKQVEAKLKEAQPQPTQSITAGEPDLTTVPGAFRFG